MSGGKPEGYVRKKDTPHHWCPDRPTEEHVLSYRERNHVGDIWVCTECWQVWVAVLRPSLLDAVPHWAVKWKRMCPLRAGKWIKRWDEEHK